MNDITKAKKVTEADAAAALKACSAAPVDPLFVDERPKRLQDQVAIGANGKEIAKAVGVPESIGKCAAIAYGLEEPSPIDKLKGWASAAMNAASGLKQDASQAVSDMAIKPYQGATSVDRLNRTVAPEARL